MRRKRNSAAETGASASWRRALHAWLPVVLLECLVLFLSTRPRLALPGGIPHLDKVAHFAEYAFLGGFLHRALRLSGVGWIRAWVLVGVMVAALSAGDEWLQGHVPGRESSPLDWLADLAGGLAGAWVGHRLRPKEGAPTDASGRVVGETEG